MRPPPCGPLSLTRGLRALPGRRRGSAPQSLSDPKPPAPPRARGQDAGGGARVGRGRRGRRRPSGHGGQEGLHGEGSCTAAMTRSRPQPRGPARTSGPDTEIRARGWDALVDRLRPSGTLRFAMQTERGSRRLRRPTAPDARAAHGRPVAGPDATAHRRRPAPPPPGVSDLRGLDGSRCAGGEGVEASPVAGEREG